MSMLFAIRSNDFFGSGLHPFHSAGLHPFHSAGLHPFHSTALHPFHSATSPDGYVGPSAMLVEALRTVRADLASSEPLPGPHTKFDGRFTLWRWDPKPRQEACLFDLMSRLQFDKGCMWHLPDGNPPASKSGRPAEKAFEVITITPPSDAVLDEQVQLVLKRSRDRGDRLAEILVQAEDVWPFWSAVTNLMPAAIPFTCELIELGRRFVTTVVMRFKHDIACLRPASISPHVQPVIPT
ncbi:MAG TPA: hypothetical protein VGP22_10985, partial [Albitalea sp.]|nr:hypothetical protein [Albitalea sp.]